MAQPIAYISETIEELKRVTWPTQQEVVRLTGVILIVSVIVGLYIGGIDYVLTKVTETLLR